jgi:hypothetical protein
VAYWQQPALLQNDQHWRGVTGKETGVDYGTLQTEYSVHVHSGASLVESRIGRNDIHIGALGRVGVHGLRMHSIVNRIAATQVMRM